jgi:HEAT repeat protein
MLISAHRWAAPLSLLLLSGCSRDPIQASITQLQSPNAEIRQAAARTLGEQAVVDARAIEALSRAVADSDPEVRWLAIDALAGIGAAAMSSLPALAKALDDPDSAVRLRAALATERIDPSNASFIPVLTKEMRAGNGHVLLAVGAMGKDAAWAVPTLIALLSHQSPKVRALAAQTLGRIGPAAGDARTPLQRATHDTDPAVQSAAQVALGHL